MLANGEVNEVVWSIMIHRLQSTLEVSWMRRGLIAGNLMDVEDENIGHMAKKAMRLSNRVR